MPSGCRLTTPKRPQTWRAFSPTSKARSAISPPQPSTAQHAVIDNDRPPGARASQPPTAAARAVSWRLHGLAHALHASREICQAAQGASASLRARDRLIAAAR